MRVALFTDTFLPDVNGVARTLGRWVNYLDRHGIPCKVFAPDHKLNDSANDRNLVQRYYSIPFMLYPEVKLAIPNPINLKRTLKEFQPTIIHVATPFNLGLSGMHYAKKHNIPLVASYHTHFDQYLSYYKIQWIENTLWRYMHWFHHDCRKIYVPSQSTKDYLLERGMKNLDIWGRGIDMDRFKPDVDRAAVLGKYGIDPNKFIMLYVGRLAPEKTVDVLLQAYRRLSPDMRRNTHLLMAGDGPLYKDLTSEYEGASDITFTGFMQGTDLTDLYAAADVFVFPSATETFGNVVLESMASGTPVIGAAAGGVKDNIKHEETGILCEPGNVEEFAQASERLYRDREFLERLSQNGLEYCKQQSWDQIFERLLLSYSEVLGENLDLTSPARKLVNTR